MNPHTTFTQLQIYLIFEISKSLLSVILCVHLISSEFEIYFTPGFHRQFIKYKMNLFITQNFIKIKQNILKEDKFFIYWPLFLCEVIFVPGCRWQNNPITFGGIFFCRSSSQSTFKRKSSVCLILLSVINHKLSHNPLHADVCVWS